MRRIHIATCRCALWNDPVNRQAANKLLKLIEEPPHMTLIIMVSENTENILPTILSRTQLLHVPPLPDSIIREALLEGH